MMNKRNDALDAMKACAALMVIFLHFLPEKNWWASGYLRALSRIAVPYFFCVSGFFYGRKEDEKSRDYALRQCKKLVKLLFLLYAVAIFEDLVMMAYKDAGIAYLKKSWSPILTWRFLLLNFRFTGSGWFLRALIYVILLYAAVLRRFLAKHEKGFMIFTGILVILFPLGFKYLNVMAGSVVSRTVYEYSTKYIGVAFCYFTFGVFFGRHACFQKLSLRTKKILAAGVCGVALLNCAERYVLVHYAKDTVACDYLTTPILTLLLFLLLLNVRKYSGKILADIGRRDSTYIYIFHLMIGHFFKILLNRWKITLHPLLLCLAIYAIALCASRIYQAGVSKIVQR